MGFNFECCDRSATAHGTCEECFQAGRHETAGRAAPRAVPKAKPMVRLTDMRPNRSKAVEFFVALGAVELMFGDQRLRHNRFMRSLLG